MKKTTRQPKPRLAKGPHIVYCVIGTDGSFVSEVYWHREHADEYVKPMGAPCRVEKFRLVRVLPKRRRPAGGSR
jgi:hypothetical protein